ncbi:urokinase plasminogen activator surface receptor-like isoform X2 [Chiloscyllium plagiosum]|uniref:urokinase plasminogen activator surface receptor-like isoform X2 n=1 Tax=Chiloscyllium plagiosum TaxID=36176 RepID=UPI001CB7EC4D|nr:urokinase plasminogen activator surface receptor-like isoform X2 [Chiloscyllium plagiosum]
MDTAQGETNTTLSGLQCYGCVPYCGIDPTNMNCTDPSNLVKYVGQQTHCLHSSATDPQQQNVIVKGCASESICRNPDVLMFYDLQPKEDFYCCQDRGCNRWDSGVSSVQTATVPLLPLIALVQSLFQSGL